MSDTNAATQQQIFHEPLQAAERATVAALVASHEANAALTQQLALDASRLITTSRERLSSQSGAGFFKRFVSSISGNTSESQLLNQVDMLQLQKYAWHYLQQLQQQNLINAQSIAIIRNNLGTMNDYLIETRGFLEQAIDRIDGRLRDVESSARFNNWSLNIEANKRRFKSFPSTLLVLRLAYDFMRCHSDVAMTSRDIDHLVVTLEKLGIDCDEKASLLDFIMELIDQIAVTGLENYRGLIELSFDGHVIAPEFVQKNISGIGFNALYYLSEQYEKITSLIDDDALCDSDDAREKIISRFFGTEFSGLSTTYDMRELVAEVVGGSLVAIDIYKELNGLNVRPQPLPEEPTPETETVSLVSSLPDIRAHSFLDGAVNQEDRRHYVELLALCLESPEALGRQGREFIAQLAEKAGFPEICKQFPGLIANQQTQDDRLQILQRVLDDTDKAYGWLLDAFFLLALNQGKIENPKLMRVLNALKPARFKENLGNLLLIVNESDESRILHAAESLARLTHGWKNVIRYRELHFEAYFDEAIRKLHAASWAGTKLTMELVDVSRKASDYSYYQQRFDDGFLSKVGSAMGNSVYAIGRKSALNSLNELRGKAVELISTHSSALHQANHLCVRWGMPAAEFENRINRIDYDLDNSASNEDWYDQFEHHRRQVEDTLGSFSSACDDAQSQLALFAKGDFDQSIIEARERRHIEWQRQQQQDSFAKRSARISRSGMEALFSIQWEQAAPPPCDPESIRHIKTDGRVWLIATNDHALYRSEDRLYWQQVHPFGQDDPYVNGIDVVDGVWILFAGYNKGFYHSIDARSWQRGLMPERGNSTSWSPTEEITHFNGLWLWRFTHHKEYEYTEKGFLFDSTETSFYDQSVLFCASSLDGQWHRWEGTPKLPEGAEIRCIRSLPGVPSLLAFCEYDSLYTSYKKKTNASPFVRYYLEGKGWRDCTWNGEHGYYRDIFVTRMNDQLMCFLSNQLLRSDKGYVWNLHDKNIHVGDGFHLDGLSLFPSRFNSQVIHLSQDAVTFKEIMLEDGSWKHFCANDQGALGVYSPNSHETFLRIGSFVFHPVE